jgi:cytochrome subunit of sulfide dehydrogenase
MRRASGSARFRSRTKTYSLRDAAAAESKTSALLGNIAMKLLLVFVCAAIVVGSTTTGLAGSFEPPVGAMACSGCHPEGSGVETSVPRLAGRKAQEIVAQMRALRSGQRGATVMDRIAKGYSDAEVEAIAKWYEAQQ